MAASKSVSRRSSAKKAAKIRKSRATVKKVSKTRKPRVGGKKAAVTHKQRVATKNAAAIHRMKTPASAAFERRLPSESLPAVVEIDNQIALARANLRALVEQATSSS